MDHSKGIQMPPGLLPSVNVLTPGLVLLFKSSTVDRRYVLEHIHRLDKALGKTPVYPNFQEVDLSAGSVMHATADLIRLREAAIKEGRTYFILTTTFGPRVSALEQYTDWAFHYVPGMSTALLIATKIRGDLVQLDDPNRILILVREQSDAKPTEIDQDNAITITVRGKIHSGRSAVSAIINNALKDKWPLLSINWVDPDNSQNIVQSNLAEGRYDTIGANSFNIVNETAVTKK